MKFTSGVAVSPARGSDTETIVVTLVVVGLRQEQRGGARSERKDGDGPTTGFVEMHAITRTSGRISAHISRRQPLVTPMTPSESLKIYGIRLMTPDPAMDSDA